MYWFILYSSLYIAFISIQLSYCSSDLKVVEPIISKSFQITNKMKKPIQIIFSDVDGTLVHYPDLTKVEENKNLLYLPASSTGMRGIISYKTLELCSQIREEGKKIVLVSGMRTSTLFSRLPYLPKADAYCSDGGGRIFYRVDEGDDDDDSNRIYPKNGDLPFHVEEDMKWRSIMEDTNAAGRDGYKSEVKLEERQGLLWDYARSLMERGWILDTKGYATCFRINRKQQLSTVMEQQNFDDLTFKIPDGLSSSVNLGCIDIYPKASGKKHWYVFYYIFDNLREITNLILHFSIG